MPSIDVERVVCRFADLEDGDARSFVIGTGDWPLRGFVVRVRSEVRAYVNHCPHAGHPLNLLPNRFLTPDRALIICASHGALFDRSTGFCIAGPCAGRSLQPVPIKTEEGFVLLADDADLGALADRGG